MRVSPEIERIYRQLIWSERKRSRIISSVASHFGKNSIQQILEQENVPKSPLSGEPDFLTLIDERSPADFLTALAQSTDYLEAKTVAALRAHVSVYQQHVDEQILFGARTAGQEGGRAFLASQRLSGPTFGSLSVPEAIQAVFEITYNGLPWVRSHFLCLRSMGASTVHYSHSPHLTAWKQGGGDPRFLYQVKSEWIKGILDILSPGTEFSTSQSIEQGGTFGLAHFHIRGLHASP